MSSIYDTILHYVRKYEKESNPNVTMESFPLVDKERKGEINLKWWKENGIVYITYIRLDHSNPPHDNTRKHLLTKAVNALINLPEMSERGVKRIDWIGISNNTLLEKMTANGWSTSEYHLYMYF